MFKVGSSCNRCPSFILKLQTGPLYGYSTFCLSIRQLMDILITFPLFVIWGNTAKIIMYRFLCEYMFSIFFVCVECISGNGIAGAHGNSLSNFVRKLPVCFQSSCTILHHPAMYKASDFFTFLSTSVIFYRFFGFLFLIF